MNFVQGDLLSPNAILWASTLAAVATASLALFKLRWAMPGFIIWIASADFLKRILFLGSESPPSELEYYWMLTLPDLILAAAILRIGVDALKERSLPFRPGTLDYLVGAFFVWSALEALNPTFPIIVRLAGFKSSGIYVLVYLLVRVMYQRDKTWLGKLVPFLAGTAAVASIYALYQAQFGFAAFELDWLDSSLTELGSGVKGELGETIAWFGIVRPFSIFASHEQLGWYLSFVALVILAHWGRRPLGWILLILLMITVARTLSRSSWVFLGLALGLTALGTTLARRKMAKDAVIALLLFVGAIGLWTYINGRMSAENPYLQRATVVGSYEWRIFSFQEVISETSWHRLLGNGIGSMWVAWRMKAPGTFNPDERILSHVGTVDIVYELGIVGLVLFVAIILAAAIMGLRHLRSSDIKGQQSIGIVGIATVLAVFIANSIVTTVLMFRPIAVPFWAALGIVGSIQHGNIQPAGHSLSQELQEHS